MVVNNIEIEVERKSIKHLHLSVYPPDGRVHASVPNHYTDEQIRLFVLKKMMWLLSKRKEVTSYISQSERKYVSGESHFLLGKPYRLKVVRCTSGSHLVTIQGDYIVVFVYENTKPEAIANLLMGWYKQQLTPIIERYVQKWEECLNVHSTSLQIMQMPASWGKCHKASGRIRFNVELAKKPLHCIEYVVVHELAHLIEQNHSDHFQRILTSNLPTWKNIKQELNEFPL